MSLSRIALSCALLCTAARAAAADEQAVSANADGAAGAATTDLRLTLSSFMFRESGDPAAPLVDGGAPVASASTVRRTFGDLRVELSDGGFALDGRVRQTTSARYQSGAAGGSEYELRTLRLRVGSTRTALTVGRQYIDAVGATKIDGVAIERRVSTAWSTTLFGGTFPVLGSRSLDTDYAEIRLADGSEGSPLIPITGGVGTSYSTASAHGSLGAAAVYVAQDVPGAPAEDSSRVFVTANGYARPARWLDVYHFGLFDVAGGAGAKLTNGSVGVNVRATAAVQLSGSVNHVSTDVLQIAARNTLVDPDPTAMGIVQNNIALVRVSQDLVRGGASVALASGRFELSASTGFRRRPGVDVRLADGSAVTFPEATSADVTTSILDRRSLGGLRVSASVALFYPLGDNLPNRSQGTVGRLAAGRTFAHERGSIELDVMAERFRDARGGGMCTSSLDVLACYGAAKTTAAQAGALASWRIAREWLLVIDAHLGARDVTATSLGGVVEYPTAYSLTAFARAQWRYR
jgi:hypothetical protein